MRRTVSSRACVLAALVATLALQHGARAQQTVPLTAGMVIDRSIVVRPGIYRLAASADLQTPAVTIRGKGVTIDFNGAELAGSADGADPDTMAGVGILIDGGSAITVKNAVVRGYKVGILARGSADLHLTRNDLSYNWKPRLHSGIDKESLVDWMSYHQNDKDEWLRYGAAMYLSKCDRAEVDRNTAVQGQNGLMMTASAEPKIWNNTFQYLSGVGVGLYRITKGLVMHNRIDWCVRGYSHGYYNRGQDSAGLLMYEQSSGNLVAFNSITHGGDGLFLWAGQSTMDSGRGGSNDNFFFRNDFSHAPANGIEATFSRNVFVENRIEECWHGVWGGYSYESKWIGNRFARNTEGIAIEHGQSNRIQGNTFDGEETAIRLWQNPSQDPHWGYPSRRDTASRGYVIWSNTFRNTKTAVQLRDTADVTLTDNHFEHVASRVVLEGKTPDVQLDAPLLGSTIGGGPDPLPDGMDATIKPGERRGRETIVVDEWGPYDWKSPKLWPAAKPEGGPLTLRILGPEGDWRLVSARGASVTPERGRVGGQAVVTPSAGAADAIVDVNVALEYRGAAVTSPRGQRWAAGEPYRFEFSRFVVPIEWRITFFEYTDASDPVKEPAAFARLLGGAPLKEVARDRLDYVTGRSLEEGVPRDKVALVAEAAVELPPGAYTLQVISDDGVKVWVDGEVAIDAWTPHESKVDRAPLSGGKRRFKIEYYEAGGFAELRFDIQRR